MTNQYISPVVTRSHRGIYGIIKENGKILVIKKARGPYTGLYDLPGGSPEPGETVEQTLIREIKEETNCDVLEFDNIREKTIIFSDFTKESGEVGCLQHTGVLFDVKITGKPSESGDGLDSNGAVWIDIDTLSMENATPFVLIGIGKEIIALADDYDNLAGCAVRKQPIPSDRHPMIAAILLYNNKGNIILQRIALTKNADPGKWSFSAAGHVDATENYEIAAVRELKEEMGVSGAIQSFIGETHLMKDGKPRAFFHVFKVISDDAIIPDKSEVEETKEFTPLELKQLITENPEQCKDIFVEAVKMYLKNI